MNKYNFTGAKINAKNLHIGDNYHYDSSEDFLSKNNDFVLTQTEKELVKIIFDNTESEEERSAILNSLKLIKSEKYTETNTINSSIGSFSSFLKKLKGLGNNFAFDLTYKFIADIVTKHNLDDKILSLL